jgi:hypothetical protein
MRSEEIAMDPDKVAEDHRFDDIFVLRTNTDLDPLATMLCHKQLTFRTAKHLLSTQPIFHKLDETIRGHRFDRLPKSGPLVLATGLDRVGGLAPHTPDLGQNTHQTWGKKSAHEQLKSVLMPRQGAPAHVYAIV